MSLDKDEVVEEVKDYTRQIWIAVFALFLIAIAVIAVQGDRRPANSEVTTKHILISYNRADPTERARAKQLAEELRQRIADGEDFGTLAAEYSDDPGTASKGGYLGPTERGSLAEPYDNFAWNAPIGELSEVIETSFGFHLIVVLDRYISDAEKYEEQLNERVREERSKILDLPAETAEEE
jgi:parvulin-like peptidyl-prolyl isomerase